MTRAMPSQETQNQSMESYEDAILRGEKQYFDRKLY